MLFDAICDPNVPIKGAEREAAIGKKIEVGRAHIAFPRIGEGKGNVLEEEDSLVWCGRGGWHADFFLPNAAGCLRGERPGFDQVGVRRSLSTVQRRLAVGEGSAVNEWVEVRAKVRGFRWGAILRVRLKTMG